MTVSNNKTSHLVTSQVPEFVRSDHPTFVQFLKDYYAFMEQQGQVLNTSKNLLRYQNVDLSEDLFLQKLYDNFIKLVPSNVLADRTLILKHAKDFYRSRGSEKSVRFLLRILLNKEVEFYYPKRDILRASDGKWYIEKSVKVSDIRVNNTANSTAYSNFVNKTIRGSTSNATAIVESVDVYYSLGQLVTELKISGEYRAFEDGESIFAYYTEEGTDKYLSANLFSGVITAVTLEDGGSGYIEGASVPVEGGGGSGAQIVVSQVTKGQITTIGVVNGGAGFQVNNEILITGGTGSGATANVFTIDETGTVHPNSYNIIATQILVEANTLIGNAVYSNLHGTNANSWIANGMSAWQYSNCGPVVSCLVLNTGNNYSTLPSLDIVSNTVIRSLGILGRLRIVNGGINYSVGDKLEFFNVPGGFGSGASANVTSVAANGMITSVAFEALPGEVPGGLFYEADKLPTVNVSTTTGSGANIMATAIIGDGESLVSSSSTIGKILKLSIISGGTGYTSVPTLNLANMAAGTNGIATAAIVTGAYSYPGRYLNDDGQPSSYNFLEDRDYYQNYSYVIRVGESINKYRKALKELTHPAGMKLFGQYMFDSQNVVNVVSGVTSYTSNTKMLQSTFQIHTSDVTKSGVYNVHSTVAEYTPQIFSGAYQVKANVTTTYSSREQSIVVYSPSHGYRKSDNVRLMFFTSYANITNGLYTVTSSNTDYFSVGIENGNSAFVQLAGNTSNLTLDTGAGTTNSYVTLSKWISNSNVALTTGDSINVTGNVVTVVYSVPNSNSVIVSPPLTGGLIANNFAVIKAPFTAYGNVRTFDPVVSIRVAGTELLAGDTVYLKFSTSDTSLSNGLYSVISANSTYIKISHKDVVNTASYTGNVNVYTKTVNITSANNLVANGETAFLIFTSGDLANAVNSSYTAGRATANGFSVTSANVLTTNGNVTIKTANVTLNVASHGFSTNDSVYIWVTGGDSANLTNGYQTITVYDSNRFGFEPTKIPSSNGNITVYRNYMNVTINRTGHGFAVGNTVRFLINTGDTDVAANGLYSVNKVANTNTYNIIHTNITVSSNLQNLVANTSGTAYLALYK